MSFGDHLEELRRRLILALVAPLPLVFVTFYFAEEILRWLIAPLVAALRAADLPEALQVLSPAETVLIYFKISIIAALILSGPWILWQAWKFIQPGLYREERRFVYFLVPGSAILTAAAVAMFYYGMLPLTLAVLIRFGAGLDLNPYEGPPPAAAAVEGAEEASGELEAGEAPGEGGEVPGAVIGSGGVEPKAGPLRLEVLEDLPNPLEAGMVWLGPDGRVYVAIARGEEVIPLQIEPTAPVLLEQAFQLRAYVSFVLMFLLGLVIAFQTPLVVVLLGWIGLIQRETLRKQRRWAFMISAVLAAALTPSADPLTMFAMLIPLYLLYELGILLLWLAPAEKVAKGTLLRRGEAKGGS